MLSFVIGLICVVVSIVLFTIARPSANEDKWERATCKGIRIVAFVLVFLAIVFIVTSCFGVVPTGYTGILTTFGKVAPYTLEPGINFVAPWQNVVKMDNRVQKESVDLSCFSSDIQEVSMLYTINFQINSANAMTIYGTIGTHYYDTVIVPCVTETVKTVCAHYTAENLINNRSNLAKAIEDDLAEKLDAYNIILVSTSIENMDFTDEFTNAVEAKQVAQQRALQAQIEQDQKTMETQAAADRAIIDATAALEVTKIESEAAEYAGQKEASKNEAIANTLTPELIDYYKIQQWDGKLPSITGADSILVMPGD